MDSLVSIEQSLDDLEEVLAPLLDKSLSETVSQLDLLQKAKLQVLLPYVVNDLVFIYLRTRGVNPKTHPVVGELDRVKQYFDKIKKAEDPEKRRFAVDQSAATRFIKHAIKESQAVQEQAQREVKQGTHTRFTDATIAVVGINASKAAMAKIQARTMENQSEESSSEEGDLEVFADGPGLANDMTEKVSGQGSEEAMETSAGKKRRRGMDPWAGYDETVTDMPSAAVEVPNERQRKKSRGDQDSSSDAQKRTSIIKTKNGKGAEVIDVDELSESSGVQNKPDAGQVSRIIDVDAMDSSRSNTPVQGKSKKKKKRQKQKQNA